MGERKHKAEGGEKEAKAGQGNNAGAQAAHPILQLQQMVGNKAVTRMIRRKQRASIRAVAPGTIQRQVTDEQIKTKDEFVKVNIQAAKDLRSAETSLKSVNQNEAKGYESFKDLYKSIKSGTNSKPEQESKQ